MTRISSLICGLLFGAGLAASGMTNTAKVIGFLDIFGQWQPDLIFVMGAAVLTTAITFYFVLKRKTPLFTEAFSVPLNTAIDKPLIIGAALFGIGWGLFGYCPGPAIAALVYFEPTTVIFVLAMLVGMGIGQRLSS